VLVKNLPLKFQNFTSPLIILLIALFASFFDKQISNNFIYDYNLIQQGEYWRLITGHLLHTNTAHLLLNGAAIILLWALHGQYYSIKSYFLIFIFSALVTSFGLYNFSPELVRYVGLSGVLHGIFILGACLDIKSNDKTGYLLLLGITVKIIHEQVFGASTDVAKLIDANVAIDAHLWGAISGLLACIIMLAIARQRSNRVNESATLKSKKQ